MNAYQYYKVGKHKTHHNVNGCKTLRKFKSGTKKNDDSTFIFCSLRLKNYASVFLNVG